MWFLPAVNASLNATATVLLILGYIFIKRRQERAHIYTMLTAFGVSVLFLICYLLHHYNLYKINQTGSIQFEGPQPIRGIYLTILLTHVVLAALVPFLAGATIYLGYRDRRRAHVRIAKWTFPIWLYVSITGVVIYVMLYHIYPPANLESIMTTLTVSRI